MSDELWRAVFAVTLDATFYGMRAAIPVMAANGGGSIINTASAAGLGGVAGLAAYGAAKAAVLNLTRTAAIEAAARKVRVNAICPGSIDTPAVPHVRRRAARRRATLSSGRSPSSASVSPRRSPTSRSSSPRTRRRISPAR